MKFAIIFTLACFVTLASTKSVNSDISCINILENELEAIPNGMWENIEACAKGVVDAVLQLGADLTESTSGAVINALKFKDLVLKCYNAGGKVSQAACVVTNISEFKNTISKIISDSSELYSILKNKGVVLVDAVKSCHLRDPALFLEIQLVADKMQQCPKF